MQQKKKQMEGKELQTSLRLAPINVSNRLAYISSRTIQLLTFNRCLFLICFFSLCHLHFSERGKQI